jgi:hypothetical protein
MNIAIVTNDNARVALHTRRAWSAAVLGLLAAWAVPTMVQAAPRLRCSLNQGGLSQVVEFSPVADPYGVEAIEINGRFRFKAVVIGDARQVEYIGLYSYYQADGRWVLLHEAKYSAPTAAADPTAAALTGQNSLYAPGYEREFQYGCALAEVAP